MVCRREACRRYYLHQAGTGLPYFAGRSYQRGNGIGSFFKGLFRAAVPLLKQGARTLGRQALQTGFDIVGDVVSQKPIGEAVRSRLHEAKSNLQTKAENKLNRLLSGQGSRIKKRTISASRHSRKKRRTNKDIFNEI